MITSRNTWLNAPVYMEVIPWSKKQSGVEILYKLFFYLQQNLQRMENKTFTWLAVTQMGLRSTLALY